MRESRDALLAGFVSSLGARIRRLAQRFARAEQEGKGSQRLGEALAELHTLKGEARLLGLTGLASRAHELEEGLAERGLSLDWARALDAMRHELEQSAPLTARAEVSTESRGQGEDVEEPTPEQSELEALLLELALHAENLAQGGGKAVQVDVRVEGVELEAALVAELWPALLHLVENAVDHGLERSPERGGKPELGRLSLRAEAHDSELVLTVEDDGRGIDLEAVRAHAQSRGLLSVGEEALGRRELFELLFEPGFSTRTYVTALSGRGVGLDVVRRQIESLGGRITIESEFGQGTRFVLSLPNGALPAARRTARPSASGPLS